MQTMIFTRNLIKIIFKIGQNINKMLNSMFVDPNSKTIEVTIPKINTSLSFVVWSLVTKCVTFLFIMISEL